MSKKCWKNSCKFLILVILVGDCVETSLRPCSRLVAFVISPCDLRLIGDFNFSSFTLKKKYFKRQQREYAKNSHTRGCYHHWMINKIRELKNILARGGHSLFTSSIAPNKLINKHHNNNNFSWIRKKSSWSWR